MIESERQEGKARDAQKTRIAILNAAEAVFAQYGFAGARIEAIANISGYNNSLIFRYFGDKLGLYTEVLKRADNEMSELLAHAFVPLLDDETILSDRTLFKAFLVDTFGAVFDYMVDHPHFMRLINWEQAEGIQTFASIASHFEPTDLTRFEALFENARRAKLVRPDLDVTIMVVLVAQICWSVLAALPLYQMVVGTRDPSSADVLTHLREQIIALLIAGVTLDSSNEHSEESG